MQSKWIPYVIILIIIVGMVYQSNERLKLRESIATEVQKNKGIESEISKLDQSVSSLKSDQAILTVKVDNLQKQILKEKKELQIIRDKKNENINNISNYNSKQLQQFFTDNFPE